MRFRNRKKELPTLPPGDGPWTLTSHRLVGADDIELEFDGQYLICLDAETFYQQTYSDGALVERGQVEQMVQAHLTKWCKMRAINLLSYRPRSEYEVRQYLQRLEVNTECIDSVVAWLKEQNLINDREFVARWAENRAATNPMGRHRLIAELAQKGIDRAIIEETLDQLIELPDEYSCALKLAKKQAWRYRNSEPEAARRKLMAFLQRRGFAFDTVRAVTASILSSVVDGE